MLWRSNSKSRPGEDLNSLCSWWVFPLQSQHKCLVQLHNYSLYCNQFHSSSLPKIIRDSIPNLHTPCKREMTVLLASRSAGLHSLEVHLLHIYSTIQPQKCTTGYSCTTLWTRHHQPWLHVLVFQQAAGNLASSNQRRGQCSAANQTPIRWAANACQCLSVQLEKSQVLLFRKAFTRKAVVPPGGTAYWVGVKNTPEYLWTPEVLALTNAKTIPRK